jgi:hypothetical protein
MGHVVFAAPAIAHWHLHDRLAHALQRRGHRVTVLCADPMTRAFFDAQALSVRELRFDGRGRGSDLPIEALAEVDVRLAGRSSRLRRAAARRSLRAVAGAAVDLFAGDAPDLLLVHRQRTGLHRLLHFLARQFGCRTLHLGRGYAPGTIACDGEGIDGDASLCRRSAVDYRRGDADLDFLDRALAAWLGEAAAPPIPRRLFNVPGGAARGWAALRTLCRAGPWSAARSFRAWREARPPRASSAPAAAPLAAPPFLVALLQHPASPQVRLDSAPGLSTLELLMAARRAALAVDPSLSVLALLPRSGLPARDRRAIARELPHVRMLPPSQRAAVAVASAVITVNHRAGVCALLAGTPVVHLGRSPYGVPGVATASSAAALSDGLRHALESGQTSLRQRFLTQLLTRDHVWCDPDLPDENGLAGLVVRVETALAQKGTGPRYVPGPAWPLSARA